MRIEGWNDCSAEEDFPAILDCMFASLDEYLA